MRVMFVLQYPDGALAGIDWQSGGYPYPAWNINEPHSLTGVKFYNERQEALDYAKSFPELHVAEFAFTVTPVSSSKQDDAQFLELIRTNYKAGLFTDEQICHAICMSRTSFERWLDGRSLPHPAMRSVVVNWINKLKQEKNK